MSPYYQKRLLESPLLTVFISIITACSMYADSVAYEPEVFKKEIIPLLDKYCYRCHGPEKQKGDLRLDIYKNAEQILPDRKHWLLVLEQLESREMPSKKPLPTDEEYEKLIRYVDKAANNIDWEKVKQPGHVTIPLLTKEEYYNTLEELLGLKLKAHSTFSEDSEGISGFTNDRDGLFVSTSKMEKYIETAEAAIDSLLALNNPPKEWKIEAEKMFMTEAKEISRQLTDDFFGYVLNRGQMSLYDSVDIPSDGLYEISVRVRNMKKMGAATLRIDDQVKGTVEYEGMKESVVLKQLIHISKGSRQFTWNIDTHSKQKYYDSLGEDADPEAIKASKVAARKKCLKIPVELTALAKEKKVSLKNLDKRIHLLQYALEELKVYTVDGKRHKVLKILDNARYQVNDLKQELVKLEKSLKITVAKPFNTLNAERLADNQAIFEEFGKIEVVKGGPIAIDWMKVKGPLPQGEIPLKVSNSQSGADTARKILTDFLPRAFRRPVDQKDIDRYLTLFNKASAKGETFENSMKPALVAALVSPRFLFRDELKMTDKVFTLDDYQLASRLSYFLWVSMPDEELFKLAEKGVLHKPEVLQVQINRMIADKRSRKFIKAFAGEWLGFKSLGYSVMPDDKKFPEYSTELNNASKLETVLMIEDLLKNNGSLLNLIDAKYTFVNDKLARHYGIDGISGNDMRKVSLDNSMRGGLLGMSAILTSTSTPSRTSPVNRGLWVFEKLLGQHMGIPPADVPPLPENAADIKGQTLRQVFEEHRNNPACASCHDKIDPLGFGLENFDAIGRYRKSENGKEINAGGQMPDGSQFVGITGLKKYILDSKKDKFIRNISERLLSFALGRELQYFDVPAIKKITESVKDNNYSGSTLLSAVILSYPFTHQSNNTEILGETK